MKKYLLVSFLFFINAFLFSASLSIDYIVMHGSNGTSDFDVSPGEEVTVQVKYDATGGDFMSIDGIRYVNSTYNHKLGVFWYDTDPPSGAQDGGSVVSVSGDNDFTTGSDQTNDFTFIMPTYSGASSIQITFLIYGIDLAFSEITSNQYTSYLTIGSWSPASESAPSGWQKYLSYTDDTSTEAPTLDLPLATSTIGTSFTFQYDQPETAYEGSVKITFTQTGGTTDPNSPHVLEVLSEASGTDISFTLHGANLGGAPEVTVDSGGNSLVDDAEYTVKIEYQDLAQNTAASDQNSGVLYDDDESIEASGGDYNECDSFAPGSTNNSYYWMYLKKSSSGTALPVDDITFDTTGSMDASDIDNIKIWRSTDNSFSSSSDTHLLTISSGFDPLVFNFSPDEQIGQSGYYYFLTIDVSSGASGSDAIGAQIEYASDIDAYSAAVLGTFPITGGEHPLPVTMSSFTAQFTNGSPTLYWTTQSETNNEGWNIYRGTSQNMGQTILVNAGGLILGQGTTSEPTDYIYTDQNGVVENTTYYYWLESVDNGGETEMFGPISLTIPLGGGNSGTPVAPGNYGLYQNYPNPFNPSTEIRFALEESGKVILTIYNTKGQKIQTYEVDVQADIVESVLWDGRDDFGRQVASGIYFYKLQTNKESFIRKMILTK
jgi:hypothetical protein